MAIKMNIVPVIFEIPINKIDMLYRHISTRIILSSCVSTGAHILKITVPWAINNLTLTNRLM